MTLICFHGIGMYPLLWPEKWNSREPVSTSVTLSCTVCNSINWKDFVASVTMVVVTCKGEGNVDSSSARVRRNWMFISNIQSIQISLTNTCWKIKLTIVCRYSTKPYTVLSPLSSYSVWFPVNLLQHPLVSVFFVSSYSSPCVFLHIILETADFPFFPTLYSGLISSVNCVALIQSGVSYPSIFFRLPYTIFHDSPNSSEFQTSLWSPLWCFCGDKKELMLWTCSFYHTTGQQKSPVTIL